MRGERGEQERGEGEKGEGTCAASAKANILASTLIPLAFALLSLINTNAAAPSLIVDAFPIPIS